MRKIRPYILLILLIAIPPILYIGISLLATHKPAYSQAPQFYEPVETRQNPYRQTLMFNGIWQLKTSRDRKWHEVNVPHSLNNIPGLESYSGPATYRLVFDLPENWLPGDSWAVFTGLGGNADILINNSLAGRNSSYLLPLELEVSKLLKPGKNTLEIRFLKTKPLPQPPYSGHQQQFRGIIREVFFEKRNTTQFGKIDITTTTVTSATASVRIDAGVEMAPGAVAIFGRIKQRGVSSEVSFTKFHTSRKGGLTTFTWEGEISNPVVWTPSHPAIYDLYIIAITGNGTVDGKTMSFGIRNAATARRYNYFFDKSAASSPQIKGLVWQQQSPQFGPVFEPGRFEKDYRLAINTGASIFRFTTPVHHEILNYCDRTGIPVIMDISIPFDNSTTLSPQSASQLITKTIDTYKNHPSITAWGLTIPQAASYRKATRIAREMQAAIDSLDPARPFFITHGCNDTHTFPQGDFRAVSLCLDAFTLNPRKIDHIISEIKTMPDKRKIIIPSLFATGDPDSSHPIGIYGSEQNQVFLTSKAYSLLAAMPEVRAVFLDSFSDYSGIDGKMLHSGLTTIDRAPKLRFEIDASLVLNTEKFRKAPLTFIFPGTFFVLILALTAICLLLWEGAEGYRKGLFEPDFLFEEEAGQFRGFLYFGIPAFLLGVSTVAFCITALISRYDPATARFLEIAGPLGSLLKTGAIPTFTTVAAFSLSFSAITSLLMSLATGITPSAMLDYSFRCSVTRLMLIITPFFPFSPIIPLLIVLAIELSTMRGCLARRAKRLSRASLAVVMAAYIISGFALFYISGMVF